MTTTDEYDLTPDEPIAGGAGAGSASGSGSTGPRWVTTGSGTFQATFEESSEWSASRFVTSESLEDWVRDWLLDEGNAWNGNPDDLEVVPDDGLNYSYTLYSEAATATRRTDVDLTLTYGEGGWLENGTRTFVSTATNRISESTSTYVGHDWQTMGGVGWGGYGGATPDGTMSLQRYEGTMAPTPQGVSPQTTSSRGSAGTFSNFFASREATSTLVDTATDGVWSGWNGQSFDTLSVNNSGGSFTAGDYQRTFDAGAGLVEGHFKSQQSANWSWTANIDTTFVDGIATVRSHGSGSGGEGGSYEFEGTGSHGGDASGAGSGSGSGSGNSITSSGTISERLQAYNGLGYEFSWDGDDWSITAGTDSQTMYVDGAQGEGGGDHVIYDFSYAGTRTSSNSYSSSSTNGDQTSSWNSEGGGSVTFDYKIQTRQNSNRSETQSRIGGVYTASQSSSGSGSYLVDYRQSGTNHATGSTYVLDSWHEETTESSGNGMFDYQYQSQSQSSGSSWSNSFGAGGQTYSGTMHPAFSDLRDVSVGESNAIGRRTPRRNGSGTERDRGCVGKSDPASGRQGE